MRLVMWEEAKMRVADLMITNVASCRSDEPLSAAASLMWDCDCGAVPVIEAGGDRVVGMITDRDICMCSWMQGAAPQAIPVIDAMSRTLVCCSPRDSLAEAERAMRTNQIRRVPVVDDGGRLVGILSLADIVRQAERERGRGERNVGVRPDEVASTFANIVKAPLAVAGQASGADRRRSS
jgi:CBS domain-containing protein